MRAATALVAEEMAWLPLPTTVEPARLAIARWASGDPLILGSDQYQPAWFSTPVRNRAAETRYTPWHLESAQNAAFLSTSAA
jgi:hypothetical protein